MNINSLTEWIMFLLTSSSFFCLPILFKYTFTIESYFPFERWVAAFLCLSFSAAQANWLVR